MEPVEPGMRIRSLDVMRGVAVLGILLMNLVSFSLPDPAYWDPSILGGETGWNLRFYLFDSLLVEGSMRAIFSMLFGAGVILFTTRKSRNGSTSNAAVLWYRRTTWLILLGLLHAYLMVFPGEVLFAYGVVGLFLFPVRNSPPARLLLFSLLLMAILATLRITEYRAGERFSMEYEAAREALATRAPVTRQEQAGMENWERKMLWAKPDEQELEEKISSMRSGYLSALVARAPYILYMQTGYFFRIGFLDTLSMMLLGMALFRWGIFHARRSPLVYLAMLVAGYGLGLTINWLETKTYVRSGFDLLTFFKVNRSYDLGRVLIAMGHIGTTMLLVRLKVFRRVGVLIAAAGRMALTNYLLQSLIATTLFIGFRQFGQWQRFELGLLAVLIWIFQLTFSYLWLRYFRFGPAEWLWRRLTYGRKGMQQARHLFQSS